MVETMGVNEFDHPFIAASYDQVEGAHDAPDRPGREWVVVARRSETTRTES